MKIKLYKNVISLDKSVVAVLGISY